MAGSLYTRIVGAAVMRLFIAKELNDIFLHREIIKMASETGLTSENQDNTLSG
jgi:DNA-binding phage protein